MKKSVLAVSLTIFFTLSALAIALPTLVVKINNERYQIRGIDPKDLNPNYVLEEFTMQPAIDLQGGNIVNLDANLSTVATEKKDQEFQRIKDIIFTRLTLANINDFELTSLVDKANDKYRIVLKLPANVPTQLVNLLVTTGKVNIWVEDPNSTIKPADMKTAFDGRKVTDISNEDFAAVQLVSGDSRIFVSDPAKPHNYGLKIIFQDASVSKFFAALYSAPRQTLAMMVTIDSTPVAVQASGQVFSQLNPGKELLLYTILQNDASLDNAALAAVMATPALPAAVTVGSIEVLQPTLGVGIIPVLKIALLAGFAIAQVPFLLYFKKRGLFNVVLHGMFLIFAIALMKIFNVTLSLPLIWGFLAALAGFMIFTFLLNQRIQEAAINGLTAEELGEIYTQSNLQARNLVFLSVFVAVVVFFYGLIFLRQFAIGLGFGMITSLLMMLLPVKALVPQWFLSDKNEKIA